MHQPVFELRCNQYAPAAKRISQNALFVLLFKERKKLLDAFLAKGNLIVIHHQAWDAHHLIALLQLFKMGKIICFGSHLRIDRRDVLCCYDKVGTHGAGK